MLRNTLKSLLAFALAGLTLTSVAWGQDDSARYTLVHGCYTLKPVAAGPSAGPFRMQATDLGRYLLYDTNRHFLAAGADGSVAPATDPSPNSDWRVDVAGPGAFRLSLPDGGGKVLVARGGTLKALDAAAAGSGDDARFTFDQATGCPDYPEVEVNATGAPRVGAHPYDEVSGLIDAHMHMMAFEFLGGDAHCGRPWSPYGAPYALGACQDLPSTAGNLVLDNALAGNGPGSYTDPVGWPTFKQWPRHDLLAHEMSYYKWTERAWRGGLRMYVNLLVDNESLCKLYPVKRNACNDMAAVRLQAHDLRKLVDYIDAQSGGPGKGFMRIVTSPFEARQAVNDGKLGIVMGIEVSRLFECGVYNDVADCDTAKIDRELDEVYKLGIRDMELVNKFDNAFGGVAGDGGTTGQITGVGNRLETGKFYQLETCKTDAQDRPALALPGVSRDALVGAALATFIPNGTLPNYPAPPSCNSRGLTSLGEHLIRQMMARHMIVDPDHLDVISRSQVLSMLEAAHYSGVVSSHSWSDEQSLPRIFNLGGFVTPYAGDSADFVKEWQVERQMKPPGPFIFGFGYGADANGFGEQGGPRVGAINPIKYPFKNFDGTVTLDRQRSGERVFDLNKEGVAHYGLYPDWIEDLRMQAGQPIIDDMAKGPEAYLQMWERADGVPLQQCRAARLAVRAGSMGRVDLGFTPEQLLRSAGQVLQRPGPAWSYCVDGTRSKAAKLVSVFGPDERVAFIASTGPGHKALNVGPGAPAARAVRHTRAFGKGVRIRPVGSRGARLVYGLRHGKVRFVGVASAGAADTPAHLHAYLVQAGLS